MCLTRLRARGRFPVLATGLPRSGSKFSRDRNQEETNRSKKRGVRRHPSPNRARTSLQRSPHWRKSRDGEDTKEELIESLWLGQRRSRADASNTT